MTSFSSTNSAIVFLLALVFLGSVNARGQAAPNSAQATPGVTSSSQTATNPVATPPAETPKTGNGAPDQSYSDPKSAGKDGKSPENSLSEDWTTLKVPDNIRIPAPNPPLVGKFPDFTREFVQLTWRPWDIIDLYVLLPVGVKNPPVILYLYSFPTDTDRFKDNEFAKIATKNGFAAVGFVSAMTGQRFHDRPTKEWFVSEMQEALGSSVHDVQLILNYLAKRGDLDMTRVGMFGDGSGASIAIMTAAVDPRIQVLDLFDAWGDWPDWIAHSTLIKLEDERATYMKPENLKKVENLDPVNYLPKLTTQRVRLQYLETDTITPKAARERMEAAAPPNAKIVKYDNSKAFVSSMVVTSKLFDWAKEQLVPAVAAQPAGAGNPAQPVAPAKGSNR